MTESSYPSRRDPTVYIAAIVVIAVVSIASIAIINWQGPTDGQTILRVYTYDSFMLWGNDPDTIDTRAFEVFEEQYNTDVQIIRLSTDANGIVSKLIAESANPIADVVIGIDNILILQEEAKSVLTPYQPNNLTMIDPTLINVLDSEHYVTPFDFGLVTLIYDTTEINSTTVPELANLTFANLAEAGLASSLVTQNPHFSSPGLAFLLSEIAFQEKLVGQDWTQWWTDVQGEIDVQPGWSEAWAVWDTEPTRSMMVSYGTDPAYSAYWSGEAPSTAIAPIMHNNSAYAWVQVEGIGLVKNGPNPDLARAFIDYCLTGQVQSNIALNQWMFPANNEVNLHPSFDYALHPDDINLLNELLLPEEISANLTDWIDSWDDIMTN